MKNGDKLGHVLLMATVPNLSNVFVGKNSASIAIAVVTSPVFVPTRGYRSLEQ
jgi:hypothetical protein